MADRFRAFTVRARKALQLAQEEAWRLNHYNSIGTEHLLLGLVREGDGVAARALAELNVELAAVRDRVEFLMGRGDRTVAGGIGLTPRAKKVIELGVDEARRLDHPYIGTEHLLLGLVREGGGIAAGVLESLGVGLDAVRAQVICLLDQPAGSWPATAPAHPPTSGGLALTIGAARAREEAAAAARWLYHPEVGTAHLLVGLLRQHSGRGAGALRAAGVRLRPAVAELERLLPPGPPGTPAGDALSAGARQALDRAQREARRRGAAAVGTEHLLLGLLEAAEDEPVQRLVTAVGSSPAAVRAALEPLLGGGGGA
jgi:ATP-dependent Clp protease ATP-binding subunit ClpA